MPMFEVIAPVGAIQPEARDTLMNRLTDTLLKWEGVPDEYRTTCWSHFTEVAPGSFYVGGVPTQDMKMRVLVTVPEGALDQPSRDGLVADVDALLADLLGEAASGRNSWTLIREIRSGNWGVGGRIFHSPFLKEPVQPRPTASS